MSSEYDDLLLRFSDFNRIKNPNLSLPGFIKSLPACFFQIGAYVLYCNAYAFKIDEQKEFNILTLIVTCVKFLFISHKKLKCQACKYCQYLRIFE